MNPAGVERSLPGAPVQASASVAHPRPARVTALAAVAAAMLVASSPLASESTRAAASPSRVPWTTSRGIAPEHARSEIATVSDETWGGRVASKSNGTVIPGPVGADETVVLKSGHIRARRVHAVSAMPAGMVDALARDEVLDLVAYQMAGSAR